MLKQLLLMFGLAVLVSVAIRPFQDKTIPFWGFPEPLKMLEPSAAFAGTDAVSADSAFKAADHPYKVNYSMVSALYMKRKKENIHFVDARDVALYNEGHIPGAANIPWEHIADYQKTLDSIPKTDLVLIYCDGGDCHLSHDLSEHMNQQGWKRVAVYEGGWAEWSTETDLIEKAETLKN
jgi:rhodanese-related sulfurtransferase